MEKKGMPNNIVSEDLAEQELKRIFNRRGFDKPTIEYPLQLFMDILDWHITELKKREAEARIDEVKRFGGDTVHPTFCKTRGDQFRECVECLKEQRLAQLSHPTKEKEN